MKALIDNNIQIYRTITSSWAENHCNQIFDEVEPVLTDYVLMEYRKTVLQSIEILCILIRDIQGPFNNSVLRQRLGDLLENIGSPTNFFISPRKKNLILSILGFFINQHQDFLNDLNPDEFIEHLIFWAEELEHHQFYVFNRGGKKEDVRKCDNYHEIFKCSLSDKNAKFNCSQGKFPCRVKSVMKTECYQRILDIIMTSNLGIYGDVRDSYQMGKLKGGGRGDKSVGVKCFKISDLLHATSCLKLQTGMVTSDEDLSILTDNADIKTYFYVKKSRGFRKNFNDE